MRNWLFRPGFGVMLATAAVLSSSPAVAHQVPTESDSSRSDPVRVVRVVSAADLDLTTREGKRALKERVDDAASLVCADMFGDAANPLDRFNCRIATKRDANKKVNNLVRLARSGEAPALASTMTLEVRK